MAAAEPLVSIVIPHHADAEVLLACLTSLARDTSYPNHEIWVVDNGSSDGSAEAARQRFPAIQVLRLEENLGYAGGCNRGIQASRGEYVVLLNNDTELEPGWLRELVNAAESDPKLGACQPKIRSMRERSQFEYAGAGGGLLDLYAYPFSRGRLMGHVEVDRGQYDDPVEVFWASGVCILIRRAALADTGGLDEVMFCYMEEIDLCWRLHLTGWRVGYVPTAIVYHIGYYSQDMRVVRRMYLNHRNSLIMLIKNYSGRSLAWILPIKIGLELFIFTGALLRNPRRSGAVLRSFGWLALHVPTLLRMRREVQARRRVPDAAIFELLYLGMAPLWYFLFGVRQVTDLPDIDRVLHRPLHPGQKPPEGERVHPERRDFLYAYLDQAPTGLALMRAVECDLFARHAFERPILDVGCGDGTFARMLFNGVIVDAAVDLDPQEAERARATRCYAEVRVGSVEALPFESGSAASVLCNSVLAVVQDCDAALAEIQRVLRPGGRAYLTVPSPRCKRFLFWSRLLAGVGMRGLAQRYAEWTPTLFRARHLLEPEEWVQRLEQAGLRVEACESYMAERTARVQDAFLPTALSAALAKRLAGRRLWLPRLHRLVVRSYRRWLRGPFTARADQGTGTFLIARRPSDPGAR
jgi:GT2 family glycosyltransferase/ubiquinone/menaquinone biosynthesis C-methylase UbiE